MPIEVIVVEQADYDAWAQKAQTAGAEEAHKYMTAKLEAKGQLAQQ
jgi:heme/copper-type cytochrome/quinol oxidase subunit 2